MKQIPKFLDVDTVIGLHDAALAQDGGLAGIRDKNLLDSAAAQPRQTMGGEFLHKGTFLKAAAYLFHIVNNHPFVDGNKRTGLAAALTFLAFNGYLMNVPSAHFYNMTMKVAEGELDKEEIANTLRSLANRQRQQRRKKRRG